MIYADAESQLVYGQDFEQRLQRVESMATANHLRLLILRRILLDKGLIDGGTLDRIWRETEITMNQVLAMDDKRLAFSSEPSRTHS